jgi:gliding motility-associated-like protein
VPQKKIYIFRFVAMTLLCTMSFANVFAQPVANFTANSSNGCAPLIVSFQDLSTGNPTQWSWDLGNGVISSQQNPIGTYFNPGTYTVRLRVQNANGIDSVIKTAFVVVNDVPTVDFSSSVTSGCYPLKTQFTDLSIANSGTNIEWLWDFGDGNFSSQQNPLHTYVVAGSFTITLQVKNSRGCTKIINKPNYISISSGIQANFNVTQNSNCGVPSTVTFSNTSVGTGTSTYFWNFGDGTNSTQPNPTKTYTTPGSYTVSLVAISSSGCRDSLIKPNLINIGAVNANFSSTGNCINSYINFTNISTPNPVSVFWNFGDGTTSTNIQPTKVFSLPGSYQVKMVANFGNCSDSITKTIVINPKPTVSFTNTPEGACSAPLNVLFTNNSVDAISYNWNFGDANTSTNAAPAHNYPQTGVFDVTLIGTNSFGCTDTLKKIGAVKIALPQVTSINGTPYRGCAPYTAPFSLNVNSPEPIVQVEWDFGDATPLVIGNNPTHTYVNTGTYSITVKVTTVSGCTATFQGTNAIILDSKPTANFSATPRNGCASDDYIFTNSSSNNVNSWFWNFGDGGTSSAQNPTYNYVDTGFFKITLIVAVNNCKDTLEIEDYIYINPPVAKFYKYYNCDTPMQRYFDNESIGALTYAWNFGDGNFSVDSNPVHVYANPGIYAVSLTVTNGACTHTTRDTVIVVSNNPNFSVNGTSFCKYANVVFTVGNINTAHVANYAWDFGDGTSSGGSSLSSTTHQYLSSGSVNPTLVITDILGCTQTVNQVLPIVVYGPTAGFQNPPGTCVNGTINFTDTSTTDGLHSIIKWMWSYGNGGVDTLASGLGNTSETYNQAGTYSIKLTVVDDYGCYDTLIKPNAVLITNPKASFNATDTLKCANNNIQFNSTSAGVNLNYVWSFGNGLTSALQNPQHAYATVGLYSVQLNVSDIFGCADSLLKPLYINVSNSAAKFSFVQGDSIGLCYPFLIEVANQSLNTQSISWNFGDGGFSNVSSPSHFYNLPGTYSLTLKAFGFGNCVDSVKTNIVVRGPTGTFSYTPKEFCKPAVVTFTANTLNNATFFWDFSDGVTQVTNDSVVTHPFLVSGLFKPKMILIDAAGCQVPITGIDTIKVIDITTKIKVPLTQFCDSVRLNFLDSTVVTNDVATNFVWNFGNGVTSTAVQPQHFYSQPGNYTVSLKVTSSFGCTATDTLNIPINVVQSPVIRITGDSVGCINNLLNYNAVVTKSDSSALSWNWNLGNGLTSTLRNPPQQFYSTPGIKTITAISTNTSGCADTVSKSILIHPTPNTSAGIDTVVCRGKTITLNATGANTYVWKTDNTLSCLNCANPIARPDSLRLYTVIGTNNFGCSFADSMYVNVVQPFQINFPNIHTLCVGESKQLVASGADSYLWSPNTNINNIALPNPTVNPSTTTTYTVVASDSRNCFRDTGTVLVKVYPIPQITFPNSVIKSNVGSVLPLANSSSNDITTWRWLPSTWLSCNDCATPIATITDNIKYIVEVSNPGGCTARNEVSIETLCNGFNVFIPNTFSPNGDGMNDVFYPRGKGLFTVRNMKIFNRWGELVFSKSEFAANNPANGWNGTFNGKALTPDVYVYSIEVVCDNNQIIPMKGNIMLVR